MPDVRTSDDFSRDHEALRQNALDLRWALASKSCSCGSQGGCRCLVESLGEFCRHVSRHFDDEEREWSESGNVDWTSRTRIDTLIQEHVRLRTRLAAGLAAFGDAFEHGRPLSPEIVAEVREAIDELLQHDLSEAGLFRSQVLTECPPRHWEG